MSSTALPGSKDYLMNDHTKLGLYMLLPPAALWTLIILLMVDSTLASYVFSRLNMTVMDMVFLIAGFIFPGAALASGVRGLSKKTDMIINLIVIVVSVVMMVLMALNILAN
ncbi:MAG TPA: hypothetical protein VLA32_08670 [Anaerolineales bacterium]|jgi:hypothetical protein|nr:hypothetical protein [Anaerolineales bacterium]